MIRKAVVTGGAGFIGSHVVDSLLAQGAEVVVFDNLSTGKAENLAHIRDRRLTLHVEDTRSLERLVLFMTGCDFVFHLQANADVRGGPTHTRLDLEQNIIPTWNVLEAMRLTGVKNIAFASSATVYGEPDAFPTTEEASTVQTSLYGASKLSGEALIQAFGNSFGFKSWIFRFVSFIGPRYSHGVVVDFMRKLKADPRKLEILGDGRQRKSYLDVSDGVEGIMQMVRSTPGGVFNLGHVESASVIEVADWIIEDMGLTGVRKNFTGGERGWIGDSPMVSLDTARVMAHGWEPKLTIRDGIRRTVASLLGSCSEKEELPRAV